MKILKWIIYFFIFVINVLTIVLMHTLETPIILAYIFGVIWEFVWTITIRVFEE